MFKVWVKTGTDPKWYTNAMEYATEDEAKAAAVDLAGRWLLVTEHTTAKAGEDPNERAA